MDDGQPREDEAHDIAHRAEPSRLAASVPVEAARPLIRRSAGAGPSRGGPSGWWHRQRGRAALAGVLLATLLGAGTLAGWQLTAADPVEEGTARVAGDASPGQDHDAPEGQGGGTGSAVGATSGERADPPDPEGLMDASSPGPTTVRADVTGDGRKDAVVKRPEGIEVRPAEGHERLRYEFDRAGGQVVLGDWTCDGAATPAVYRESTGEVFLYERWPEVDATEEPSEVIDTGVRYGVAEVRADSGCDRVEVTGGRP